MHRYASEAFRVPLTISTDGMKPSPEVYARDFISWDAVVPGGIRKDDDSQYNKVRLMIPATVYRPGSSNPEKPPTSYARLFRSLAQHGVRFSDRTKLTVGGRQASVVTAATTRHGFDGSIGCLDARAPPESQGCFGIQPDVILRIAVLRVGATPLVAWARTSAKAPDRALFTLFRRMLTSIRFR